MYDSEMADVVRENAALRAEVAHLRAFTGADCPKCGEPLRATHIKEYSENPDINYHIGWRTGSCVVTLAELVAAGMNDMGEPITAEVSRG